MLYESQGIFPERWAFDFRQEARSVTHQHATSARSRTAKAKREADCQQCGKAFVVKGKALGKFCSIACTGLSRKSESPDWMECSRCFAKAGIGMTVGARLLGTSKKSIHRFWQKEGIVRIAPESGEWKRYAQRANSPFCGWWGNEETAAMWMHQHKENFPDWSSVWESKKASLWYSRKRKTNHGFRVVTNLRTKLRFVLNRERVRKSERTITMIGCTYNQLKVHLESGFKRGMTWDNYGTLWHVDHIIPCAAFDHTDPKQRAQCWHWTNLRALDAKKNLQKSDKITEPQMSLMLCATR